MKPKFIYRSVDIFSFRGVDEKPDAADFQYHTHLMCEVYYFIQGKAIFHVEGTQYELKPGDILIMRPTEAHFVEVDPEHYYERLVINFNPELLRSIDPKTKLLTCFTDRESGTENLYRPENPENNSFLPYLQAFQDSHGDRMTMIANLILLLNQIEAIYSARQKKSRRPTTLEAKILATIDINLPRAISLDELCNRYFISKSQLNRRFKQATGTTVGKYINTKRLILAQQLIRDGVAPTEVYCNCGFQDYSSFYRAYFKYFGHSPKKDLGEPSIPDAEDYKLILK